MRQSYLVLLECAPLPNAGLKRANQSMETAVHFPFVRDRKHSIGELRAFEAELLTARQRDQAFSAVLRTNQMPWAKVRNEELLPIKLFADHTGMDDEERFRLMPEGHDTDVEIFGKENCIKFQITVADPIWDDAHSGGYLRSLRMDLLQLGMPAFGGARVRKEKGVPVSEPHARSAEDDIRACITGLVKALDRKRTHVGAGQSLLIYAREFSFLLIDADESEVIASAIAQAGAHTFDQVYVVDERFIWRSDMARSRRQ